MARPKREGMAPENLLRFRLTVPAGDVTVLEWIEKQYNVSQSIRQLIREFVREHGLIDATCIAVEQEPPRQKAPHEPAKRAPVQEQYTAAPAPAPAPEPKKPVGSKQSVEDANDALSDFMKNGLMV